MDPKPLLLFSRGGDDAEFRYASGFSVEQGLYARFGAGDDLLVVSALELDRARAEGRAAQVADRADLGWQDGRDLLGSWAEIGARVLTDRGAAGARTSALVPAGLAESLRETGVDVELDRALFVTERRRKSADEVSWIARAQSAAEAACRVVIGDLGAARPDAEGWLVLDGRPLTSERLLARCQAVLQEHGCASSETIIAGSPECAMPHFRGAGPIRAGQPVIIDIFPRHLSTGYHGDMTRTVVPGRPSDQVARMHAACVAALDAGVALLRPGADGGDVHRGVCQALVDQGFGTTTRGLEGPAGGPRMIHSTGHGVGLDVHEAPNLRDVSYPLEVGDAVTVEPGLYEAGLGGVRVEDLLVVTDGGRRNLTTLPRSLDPADYV
ncbi:MAG TPA: Xaa-Pro peptidase family protein [Candidatus Binatia bacterium]|nr:Xaa-Pro peptidase family protein [Candidatus Binatia bacterium]